ncbi:MAG: FAD-dependent oxidoreductase [Haloarculaceae archaeon]
MRDAIVGGGVVGLASAYRLAERGADVTVFEKDALGSGSTGRANGGIRTQFTSAVNVALSLESIDVWERFEAEFGVDLGHRHTGYLFLARTPDTADRLRENVALQNDLGVSSRYLSPEAAREHCPGLYADRYVGAAYGPTDLDWAARTLEGAAAVASYFGPDTELVRGWAGLYAVTPDRHPIIEETVPGFVNAVGFSGHGFMQSPATGRVVAELVLDGGSRTVDVSALTADRFERGETLHEGTVID